MTLDRQHTHDSDFDSSFHELGQLVAQYARQHVLPTTAVAALKEICTLMDEIEQCQREGSAPDHGDIPWRVAHLILCVCLIERAGLCAGAAWSLALHLLERIGISLTCAVELARVRLRSLCRNEDMVYTDTAVLVPIMKDFLAHGL